MELDYLEKNILRTITNSSVFEFKVVKYVYDKKKSFDKTIEVLKYANERAISINEALILIDD
tara:strand:- start:927 stop:1112 length:186 start_codon:yes stop_codon:yes gene_type:complete